MKTSGRHVKEPLPDFVYVLYLRLLLNFEENQSNYQGIPKYLRFEPISDENSNDSTSKLTVLATNPNPKWILRDTRSNKLVLSISMAAELIWNSFVMQNIRKETKFYSKRGCGRNRSRGNGGLVHLIINIHKEINEFFEGIKKSFIETQLYFFLAKDFYAKSSISAMVNERFKNLASLTNLVHSNSSRTKISGQLKLSRLVGRFSHIEISDDIYLTIWSSILFKGCLEISVGKTAYGSGCFFSDSDEFLTSENLRKRLRNDRYAVLHLPERNMTEICSLHSNFDPSRVVIDRKTHKILLTKTMAEELTWINAPPRDCKSPCAAYLNENFNHYFTGFSIETIKNALEKLSETSSFVDLQANFEIIRKERFLTKTASKHFVVQLYAVRKRLMDELWNEEKKDFNVDENLVERVIATNRWSCETNFQINQRLIFWRNCVLRRDYRSIERSLHEFNFDPKRIYNADRASMTSCLWRLGVFLLQNRFEIDRIDDHFDKIYRFMDFLLNATTRANAWRMFSDVFSTNLAFSRSMEVERMMSMLAHKKFRQGERKNDRKIIELYLSLIYYKIFCDERKELNVSQGNFEANSMRVTKTVDMLLNYGRKSIDFGRLTNLCVCILDSIVDDDESISSKNNLESILIDHLKENPGDASSFATFVEHYPDHPLVSDLIDKHSSQSCVPRWCRRRIKRGDKNFRLFFKLLFQFLDHNSNRNCAKTWKTLRKLLLETKIYETFRSEIAEIWRDRSDWWEVYQLRGLEDKRNSLYSLKKSVIKLLRLCESN